MKNLVVILARGGSKRILHKNTKILAGRPLIAYSILAARKSKYVNRIIVSTDDPEIKRVAKDYGAECPFLRPSELSTDTASSISAIQHAVKFLENQDNYQPDYVILLQPTSPLRTVQEIDAAIESISKAKGESLVSVTESFTPPHFIMVLQDNQLKPLIEPPKKDFRRQDLPTYLQLSGSIFIATLKQIFEKGTFRDEDSMPFICENDTSFDIDTPLDWEVVSSFLKHRNLTQKKPIKILNHLIERKSILKIAEISCDTSDLDSIKKMIAFSKKFSIDGIYLNAQTTISTQYLYEIQKFCKNDELFLILNPKSFEDFQNMTQEVNPSCYYMNNESFGDQILLKTLARTHIPILLAVNRTSIVKIDLAINTLEKEGNDNIILVYEAFDKFNTEKRAYFKKITHLKQIYPYHMGSAIHSSDKTLALQAITLGSVLIIKPFEIIEKSSPSII